MSGYDRGDSYDNQQDGGYGGGGRVECYGGRQQQGSYDDQQGDGYGGRGGYGDDQQGSGYGGRGRGEGYGAGRQQQGGYDDQQGGGYGGRGGYGDGQQQEPYGGGGYDNQQSGYSRGHQGGSHIQQSGEYSDQRHHGGGNIPHGGNYGGGGGYGGGDDLSSAVQHAQQHAGDSGDSTIFSEVANFLGQNKQNIVSQGINEQEAIKAHQNFFGGGSNSNQSANTSSMGTAAAMQALKMFAGGGSGNTQSGNSQNAFIGIAMGQASKLFDQLSSQGNVASDADKQSVIQHAGEMALKMYIQSQGGSSGLMGLASKFM